MKKIAWVTADYFIDCDLDIINKLSNAYKINWNLVIPTLNNRYNQQQIDSIESLRKVKKTYFYSKYRFRSYKNIFFYWNILQKIKKEKPDIVYFNIQGFPYLAFICALLLKRDSVIFAVHQAEVHEGMKYKSITRLYFWFLYSWFLNFNLFSKTQSEIFKKRYPTKNIFIIPLGLKHFGEGKDVKPMDKIVFFNFGTIIKNKNIGLFIDAACNLYEKGFKNFKVKLVGACDDWDNYSKLIRYPQLFDLQIYAIENNKIADLFCGSHYLVLPYSSVSQSGPLKIAFNYNIPVIASDLEEFKQEIEDNVTGYLFKCNDVKSLEDVLKKAIMNHTNNYKILKKNQLEDVEQKYSLKSIYNLYFEMFNMFIK